MNVNDIARDLTTLVLNHLWQGALLFLAVAWLLKRFPKTTAVTSYWVWTATFGAIAMLPLASLMPRPQRTSKPATVVANTEIAQAAPVNDPPLATALQETRKEAFESVPIAAARTQNHSHPIASTRAPFPWAILLLGIWALGAAWKWLGAVRGGWALYRLKRNARPYAVDEALLAWFHGQVAAWRIARKVDLKVSTGIACPMALGFRNATVLVPQHLLNELTSSELKQVVMHELAHIKRGDDWMNLLQKLTAGLFWHHPGVAMASRRMDAARESACDDWAVAHAGGSRQFAHCLVKVFESMKARSHPLLAVGAAGDKSQLAGRVERLLNARTKLGLKPSFTTLAAFALLLSLGLGSLVLATPRPQFAQLLLGVQEPQASAESNSEETAKQEDLYREKQRLELEQKRLREQERRLQEEARSMLEKNQRAEQEALRKEQLRIEMEARKLKQYQEKLEAEQMRLLEGELEEQARALKEQEQRVEAEAQARERAEYEALQREEARLEKEHRELEQDLARLEAEESARAREAMEVREAAEAWSAEEAEASEASSASHSFSSSSGKNHSRTKYVDDGLSVDISGKVTFNEDENQILAITPGGFFEIEDKKKFGSKNRRLKVFPDTGGTLAFNYWENGNKREYDAEAQKWFAKTLPEFLRETGINGRERIQRIIESKGIEAALDYAAPVKSSHAKSLYYQGIVESGKLRDRDFERIAKDTRTMDSDHSKGRVYRVLLAKAGGDEKKVAAILENVDSIDSDHEHRQVLSEATRQAQSEKILGLILQSAKKIESDHGLGTLLLEVIEGYPAKQLMNQGIIGVSESVGSDHQQSRVLMALLSKNDLDSAGVAQVIHTAATSLESDHNLSQVLTRAAERGTIEGDAYFDAVAVMSSDHQKGQTLIRALSPGNLTQTQLKALLQAAMTIDSDHSKYEVLSAVLDRYPLTGDLEPLFRQVHNSITSDHYHGRLGRRLNE